MDKILEDKNLFKHFVYVISAWNMDYINLYLFQNKILFGTFVDIINEIFVEILPDIISCKMESEK
jgi:hypothetical protein